jgi:hypothetical protein
MPYKLRRIEQSPKAGKKLRAVFYDKDTDKTKHTDFGATGYGDYTTTGDEEQKKRYQTRHAKDLATGDPTRAGFLSYYLLWSEPTLAEAVRKYKRKFGM